MARVRRGWRGGGGGDGSEFEMEYEPGYMGLRFTRFLYPLFQSDFDFDTEGKVGSGGNAESDSELERGEKPGLPLARMF